MKKIIYVIFLTAITFMFGCKRESDVLATYKNGNITRGDFYKWLESKHFPKDSVVKSKSKQKDRIEKMAVELITISKAKDEGFDKNEKFVAYNQLTTEPVLMKRVFEKEIKEKTHFKEPAVKVRYILLRIKGNEVDPMNKNKKLDNKAELDKKSADAEAKAKELIEKIGKGEKFEELAKQYSEDFSKKKGGDAGYIVRDMMPPDFSSVAFSLKKGEYTKDPVKTPRGIYIIKVEDKEDLTEKNIDKIIEDKGQAMRIKTTMFKNGGKEYLDKLTNASDVKLFENKLLSMYGADVLFKIGEKNYSVNDFNKWIDLRQSGIDSANKAKPKLTDEQKKNMVKYYFQNELVKRDAIAKGIDKDPEYLKDLQEKTNSNLSREYTNKIFAEDVKVSPNDVREEYEKNKDNKYSKMELVGKKRVKQVEPFSKVKDRIERSLVNMKRSEKKKEWTAQLLKDYAYKLNESELEGK